MRSKGNTPLTAFCHERVPACWHLQAGTRLGAGRVYRPNGPLTVHPFPATVQTPAPGEVDAQTDNSVGSQLATHEFQTRTSRRRRPAHLGRLHVVHDHPAMPSHTRRREPQLLAHTKDNRPVSSRRTLVERTLEREHIQANGSPKLQTLPLHCLRQTPQSTPLSTPPLRQLDRQWPDRHATLPASRWQRRPLNPAPLRTKRIRISRATTTAMSSTRHENHRFWAVPLVHQLLYSTSYDEY